MVKDADRIKSELERYKKLLADDPALAKLVGLRILKRGSNDEARVDKVLQSDICEDTVTVLRDNHQQWLQDPAVFWKGPSPSSADSPDPQVQIVGRILRANPDDP